MQARALRPAMARIAAQTATRTCSPWLTPDTQARLQLCLATPRAGSCAASSHWLAPAHFWRGEGLGASEKDAVAPGGGAPLLAAVVGKGVGRRLRRRASEGEGNGKGET